MARQQDPSSSPGRWPRVERLFDAALLIPERERPAWLEALSPQDPEAVAEVRRMLEALEHTGPLDRALPVTPRVPSDALAARITAAVADRYVIEREIGRGGMATVYLAQELKHARPVVLKVLNPEIAAWWGGERFSREVRIAARLAHPHIVPLIDSGESGGLLYYVMPFVEGESLRARLARAGAIPLPEAVRLLREVADALAHAHAHGIVHRDLKPENVLCAGDHAFLLDFGIAKFVQPSRAPTTSSLATAIGTPAYMAPEQSRGDPLVDGRADIWSWGVLAHEMITGRLPTTPSDGDTPLELTGLRQPGIPRLLAELVESCLALDPAARPADAGVLVTQLDRLPTAMVEPAHRPRRARWPRLAGVAALLAAVGGGVSLLPRLRAPAAADSLAGPVAVAAFVNETGDPSLDMWGRLAGDWITQGLQQAGLLPVVPWPSALQASERLRAERAGTDPMTFLRDETGAGTIITGSYYVVGDSLQFRAMVSDARGGRLLDAPLPVTVPRDSAARAINLLRARVLGALAVRRDEGALREPQLATNPPTYEAYRAFDAALQAFLAQEYAAAAPALLAAYRLDTTFVAPLLYAASAYWNVRAWSTTDSIVRLLRARGPALSAYEREATEYLEASLAGNGERALVAIRRAAAVAPQSRAPYTLAATALDMDRPAEALAVLEATDPDRGAMRGWSSYWTQLAHAYHLLGRHEREQWAARELLRRYPDRRVGWVLEARALAAMGNTAALDSLLERQRALPPTTYWSQGAAMVEAGEELLAHGHWREGRRYVEAGRLWLETQLAVNPDDRPHREWLAFALYDAGEYLEAERLFVALAEEFPDRVRYRGMAALAAAHVGREPPAAYLQPLAPHERGAVTLYRGLVEAIRGEPQRAVSLIADAVRLGVDGLPWLHASVNGDLARLAPLSAALPASLRVAAVPGVEVSATGR